MSRAQLDLHLRYFALNPTTFSIALEGVEVPEPNSEHLDVDRSAQLAYVATAKSTAALKTRIG